MAIEKRKIMDKRIAKITSIAMVILLVTLLAGVGYLIYEFRMSLQHQGMTKEDVILYMMPFYIGVIGGFLLLIALMGVTYRYEKKRNLMLEEMIFVDEVTGGVSFNQFKLDVEEQIKRNVRKSYAFISIDVDKSKYIEEIFGTEEYNRVIKTLWQSLSRETRVHEYCGHKEADMFYAVFEYGDDASLVRRLERINDELKSAIGQGNVFYDIKTSIGVYVMNNRRNSVERLFYKADMARQSVKGQHDKLYAFYTEEMNKSQARNREMESKMEKALTKGEFFVCYQPKFSTQDKKVVGAEALVRWKMNGETVVPPSDFIPLFESNGFIKELDKFVFEQVCKDVSSWLEKGLDVKPISVNLSQLQLYNSDFIKDYACILESYHLDSKYVQLELTETALFDNPGIMAKIINQLHSMGFEILMDDFGTGYSSLNMLKDADVDTIKIDKSFVDDIGSNEKVERIIATIISLVRSMNMRVVAEGVENEMQYKFLNLMECDEIQGFYFSKPIDADAYEKLLNKGETSSEEEKEKPT